MGKHATLTNEDLIVIAKSGDKEALEQLFTNNEKFIYTIVHKFNFTGQLLDDVVSVAYMGMLKAFNAFNVDKGFKFTTFAGRCMYNEITAFLQKQRLDTDVASLNNKVLGGSEQEEVGDLLTLISDNGESVEEKAEKSLLLDKFKEFLTYLENSEQILLTERILQGKSQYAVARKLGISQPTVSKLENTLLNEFKAFMKFEEVI